MRGVFIGNPRNGFEGGAEITFFGVTFPKDEWIEVGSEVAASLAGNDHFEFSDEAEKPRRKAKDPEPVVVPEPEPDPVVED